MSLLCVYYVYVVGSELTPAGVHLFRYLSTEDTHFTKLKW